MLGVYCPPIANQIKPGQFVMLKVSDNTSPLLRRPFSVYKSYPINHRDRKKRGHLFVVYKRVGRGTRRMITLKRGEKVSLIGPLGNGFTLPPLPSSAHCILIGGGVGIVSLYPLAEALRGGRCFVFIGGKSQDDILGLGDFRKLNFTVFTATEDGSLGFKGTVVDLFLAQAKKFKGNEKYRLYACGPAPMLKRLAGTVMPKKFICEVSLEARMGCGFGACWGCVVRMKHPKLTYQRVCQEGPVFRLEDIAGE